MVLAVSEFRDHKDHQDPLAPPATQDPLDLLARLDHKDSKEHRDSRERLEHKGTQVLQASQDLEVSVFLVLLVSLDQLVLTERSVDQVTQDLKDHLGPLEHQVLLDCKVLLVLLVVQDL